MDKWELWTESGCRRRVPRRAVHTQSGTTRRAGRWEYGGPHTWGYAATETKTSRDFSTHRAGPHRNRLWCGLRRYTGVPLRTVRVSRQHIAPCLPAVGGWFPMIWQYAQDPDLDTSRPMVVLSRTDTGSRRSLLGKGLTGRWRFQPVLSSHGLRHTDCFVLKSPGRGHCSCRFGTRSRLPTP